VSIEYYIAGFNFYPGSNGLLNGGMEADSYWVGSGDQSSLWYTSSLSYIGSRSLAYGVTGGENFTYVASYLQSNNIYVGAINSYGCKAAFDGLWTDHDTSNQCVFSDPGIPPGAVNSSWLQIYVTPAVAFTKMQMMGACYSGSMASKMYPIRCEVQASNVGSFLTEKVTLLSMTDSVTWQKFEWKTFSLSNITPYYFYRVNFISGSTIWMKVPEIRFFEW
jgi:hypothetical protein